jgi:D-xylose 1-dehydrogenase (NADP+, D-xylono-1,5-lactone-forming)
MTIMKKKIKFGIIGCSTIAEKSMIPAIIKSSNSELNMIGSRSKKKSKKFSTKFSCESYGDYNEVLENDQIDAVYISLPPSLQEKWIMKAIKMNKHIICEKPSTLSIKSANTIIKECKKNQIRIIENFAFRFHPQQNKILELIKKKTIGKISSFYGNYSFNLNVSQNNFRLNRKLGGGVLNDVSCYLISASRLIFNENPNSVFCQLEYDNGIDVSGNLIMKFAKKTAMCSFSYKNYFQSFYNVSGTNGILQVERAFNIRDHMEGIITISKNDKIKKTTINPYDQFQLLIEIFSDQIINSNKKKIDFEKELLEQSRVMDAVRKSSITKKIMKI